MRIITKLEDLGLKHSETHPQLYTIYDPYKKTFEIKDRTWCELGVENFPRDLYIFKTQSKTLDVIHKNINSALSKYGFDLLLNLKIRVPKVMYDILERLSKDTTNLSYNYIEETDSLDIFTESTAIHVIMSLYCTEYFQKNSIALLPRKGTLKSLLAFMEVESELDTHWAGVRNNVYRSKDKVDFGTLSNFVDYE